MNNDDTKVKYINVYFNSGYNKPKPDMDSESTRPVSENSQEQAAQGQEESNSENQGSIDVNIPQNAALSNNVSDSVDLIDQEYSQLNEDDFTMF